MAEESGEHGRKEKPIGFTVVDRRGQAKEDTKPAPEPSPGPEAPGPAPTASPTPPPIHFTTFVLSLSSSALIQLGEIPDPFTQKVEKNLTAAQQTIDILGLLDQKTKGNLDEEEDRTLEAVLYDLRMRFLKASGRL